jgi:hypothetical protein
LQPDQPSARITDFSWLEELALSPRGSYIQPEGTTLKRQRGFTCCTRCKEQLESKRSGRPYFSIINGNFYGEAPKELTQLTTEELCFITPVRSHGYCLCYNGGTQLQLRGNLSFLRVTPREIATGTVQMEVLGLQNHVVIIAEGGMTHDQKNVVMKRRKVRPEKIIDAVKWLKDNPFLTSPGDE